ncbi:MAG: tetratricopeptide repeat protein [Muribaculaceae bacterium]|nr:tetratricopeptide repeat protein [Muribaculaceae bacterium]
MAHKYYVEGAEAWRNGDRKRAMTLYSMSANLNPDGPGAQALKMTEDIMSFFDPNQLNP